MGKRQVFDAKKLFFGLQPHHGERHQAAKRGDQKQVVHRNPPICGRNAAGGFWFNCPLFKVICGHDRGAACLCRPDHGHDDDIAGFVPGAVCRRDHLAGKFRLGLGKRLLHQPERFQIGAIVSPRHRQQCLDPCAIVGHDADFTPLRDPYIGNIGTFLRCLPGKRHLRQGREHPPAR